MTISKIEVLNWVMRGKMLDGLGEKCSVVSVTILLMRVCGLQNGRQKSEEFIV